VPHADRGDAVSVVALGAYCDVSWGQVWVADDNFRLTEPEMAIECLEMPDGRLREYFPLLAATSPDRELVRKLTRRIEFQVSEFADIADGRRIMLRDDRGWNAVLTQNWWQRATREHLAEETKKVFARDEHEDIRERMESLGIAIDPLSLRSAPYVVEFGPFVLARLQRSEFETR